MKEIFKVSSTISDTMVFIEEISLLTADDPIVKYYFKHFKPSNFIFYLFPIFDIN